jgi:hypothetical protein
MLIAGEQALGGIRRLPVATQPAAITWCVVAQINPTAHSQPQSSSRPLSGRYGRAWGRGAASLEGLLMAGSDSGERSDPGSNAQVVLGPPPEVSAGLSNPGRWSRLRAEWDRRLDPPQQSVVLSWAAFATTFIGLRSLTHWIRAGHGPSGGGMSVGGRHFHHYNIGIATLGVVGAIGSRGDEKHRRHPATAVAYGSAMAMIVDELALLLDLKDVYWASDGRKSVDVAVTVIAAGALIVAGLPLWPHARRALTSR